MVDSDHDNGVGIDAWLAFEYAKVNPFVQQIRDF